MPPSRYAPIAAVVLAFIAAALVVRIAHAIIGRLLNALDIVSSENRAVVHARAKQLTRALTLLAYGVAVVASLSLALSRFGIAEPQWDPRLAAHWSVTHGINLIIIILGAFIAIRAANLVIDVISGFFLILEDQVRIGDLARINGTGGIVEQINLRTILLRDGEGAVHVFPNGTITALANLSKQFAYAVVDIKVAYTENLHRVMGT